MQQAKCEGRKELRLVVSSAKNLKRRAYELNLGTKENYWELIVAKLNCKNASRVKLGQK